MDSKKWVWTAKGAQIMNQIEGRFVWDNYQNNIPVIWVSEGYVRPATEEDGEPGQMDLFDFDVIIKG